MYRCIISRIFKVLNKNNIIYDFLKKIINHIIFFIFYKKVFLQLPSCSVEESVLMITTNSDDKVGSKIYSAGI